jgi:hypothetical protein
MLVVAAARLTVAVALAVMEEAVLVLVVTQHLRLLLEHQTLVAAVVVAAVGALQITLEPEAKVL